MKKPVGGLPKINKPKYKRRHLDLWMRSITGTEFSARLTREVIDEWLAANGVSYADEFQLYEFRNFQKKEDKHPDRRLGIIKLRPGERTKK